MEKSQAVSFVSTYFPIEAGEEEKTNPGVYGASLARWIADRLRAKGVQVKETIAEDWGWCVIVKTAPIRLNVAVSNVDGSKTHWCVFAFAERGLLQLLRGTADLKREVASLHAHLVEVLQDAPEVSELSREDFT